MSIESSSTSSTTTATEIPGVDNMELRVLFLKEGV